MPEELFVVTGAGPVGWTVAEQLAGQGHRVRVLTRSGSGPEHHLIEKRAVDVSDRTLLAESLAGASAVFHCIHGSAYSVKAWEGELPRAEAAVLAAAGEAGAVVVFPESLYSYSEPDRVMTEDSPRAARGGKRGVRSALLQAREASATNTVSVVAGDFFGPRVRTSHAGERMVPRILARRPLQVVGSADQPHSFTFVPDLAAAMIKAAQTPALWNRVLHAPTNPAPHSAATRWRVRRSGWCTPAKGRRVAGLAAACGRSVLGRCPRDRRDAVPVPAAVRDGLGSQRGGAGPSPHSRGHRGPDDRGLVEAGGSRSCSTILTASRDAVLWACRINSSACFRAGRLAAVPKTCQA